MTAERLACLIAGRNLGDIAIHSVFLRKLAARRFAEQYLVWTRPQTAFLFADIPRCRIVCSQFPVGTSKQFGLAAGWNFLRAVLRIREARPSVTIDLIGDARERWFAQLAGSRRHVHVGWSEKHPHARLVRNPFGLGHPTVMIPPDTLNVYAAHDLLIEALAPTSNRADAPEPEHVSRAAPVRVGLHPFASQRCKLWPMDRWRELAGALLAEGMELTVFCAPDELPRASAEFAPLIPALRVFAGSLAAFSQALLDIDLLVGLDSFSVHMAHRQGVRSVTINAGTPVGLHAVPRGVTVGGAGGCHLYPCYNKAPCEGTLFEHACIKSVRTTAVLDAIDRLIASVSRGSERPYGHAE